MPSVEVREAKAVTQVIQIRRHTHHREDQVVAQGLPSLFAPPKKPSGHGSPSQFAAGQVPARHAPRDHSSIFQITVIVPGSESVSPVVGSVDDPGQQ